MAGGGAPDASGQMADTIQQIRAVGQAVDALGSSNPAFADGVSQIKNILRQMVISAAQQASVQTPSSAATPSVG